MKFKSMDSKIVVIKDGYEVAEITGDGFHVTQYNPTFSYSEMKQVIQKMKQENLPEAWEGNHD
jgi:hypothetical protein